MWQGCNCLFGNGGLSVQDTVEMFHPVCKYVCLFSQQGRLIRRSYRGCPSHLGSINGAKAIMKCPHVMVLSCCLYLRGLPVPPVVLHLPQTLLEKLPCLLVVLFLLAADLVNNVIYVGLVQVVDKLQYTSPSFSSNQSWCFLSTKPRVSAAAL